MKIAILGAGRVGVALGRRWVGTGNDVVFGARAPGDPKTQAAVIAAGAPAVDIARAAAGAGVVVLAVPWDAAAEAVAAAGDLSAKILIDCTNPVGPGFALAPTGARSAAEAIAGWAPGARVVKAFNTLGSGMLGDLADLNPRLANPVATFLCGDDPAAKETAADLGRQLGFETIDAGPLAAAALLESTALLWIGLAYRQGLGPDFAFGLVRRPAG